MATNKKVQVENSKDLLLLLLYTPGITGQFNEPIKGRTRVTKLMFIFLAEYYEKFNFDKKVKRAPEFIAYKYGPFSKEIFEDIEFFKNTGYITTTLEDRPELPDAELEEMSKFNDDVIIDISGQYENSSDGYNEELFRLSGKGTKYAEQLFQDLNDKQKEALGELKNKYGSLPLYVLLGYVYKTYPTYASKSEIKDKYLY